MPSAVRQQLLYNVTGQSFYADFSSRPASVTSVSVFTRDTGDDGTAETATTGSAAIESNPNTTFDAASGKSQSDPYVLNVAATTGIATGRQYLATDAEGQTEWAEIRGITSGASCRSRSPLQLDYVSGDTLQSTRASISVLDAWIQDSTNIGTSLLIPTYRIRWVWVDADGLTHVDYTEADVVRYSNEDHGVTPADMEKFMPGWHALQIKDHRDDAGQSLIDSGYERLQDDLTALGVPDQQVRNKDMVGRLVRYAAQRQLFWAHMVNGGDPERFTAADVEYQGMFDRVFRVETRVGLDVDEDGATNEGASPGGIWRR